MTTEVQPPQLPAPVKSHLIDRFISGGIGGITAAVIGHPLDTIKVRMQTAPPSTPPLYANTLDCTIKLWRSEGMRGLYRGLSVPVAGITPVFALSFWGYGVGQRMFWSRNSSNSDSNSASYNMYNRTMTANRVLEIGGAGAVAGLATVPVLCPLERVKCVMQVQKRSGSTAAPNAWRVLSSMWQSGGLRSVFCGLSAVSLREFAASAVYFGTYEIVRWGLTPANQQNPSIAVTLFAGGLSGVVNWLVAIPIDTLKSNLQVSSEPTKQYPHGIRSVWSDMRAKGLPISSLFRGLVPAVLRAFPANAAAFVGFEQSMKFLAYLRHDA
jgi:solute carrier family 25 (mitochondrial carnitine/acylcarnitine transporter), member 20/29